MARSQRGVLSDYCFSFLMTHSSDILSCSTNYQPSHTISPVKSAMTWKEGLSFSHCCQIKPQNDLLKVSAAVTAIIVPNLISGPIIYSFDSRYQSRHESNIYMQKETS